MTFTGELRRYQEQAKALITQRERALLALDLGTGKTIVSIAAIEELREAGKIKCALLIMSSSLTKQWEQKIQEFTDSSVRIVDGSTLPKKRLSIYEEILSAPPDYMIMGLRQAVSDMPFIQKLNPDLVLVDEVTNIKNFGTQQTKAIKKIKSRYRIGLTAEPVENGKAEELFSIMQWIDDSVLGNWREFESNYITRNSYNIITGYKNMPELNNRLMDACISKRRTDPDVAEFMPTVEEYNCYVEMDDVTAKIYKQIARELYGELRSADPQASRELASYYSGERDSNIDSTGLGKITSRLLACQLLLDDPSLLEASARAYNDPENPMGSRYASQLLEAGRLSPSGTHGAKLSACVELVEEYMAADPEHKVIVFARFKGVLPLLRDRLSTYNPVLFTGDLNGKQRGEAIFRFTNDPDTRLFLSSDAGGYGVDLWCASHLLNYDLPNSSGAFKQRNGRHVRASSKFRKVYIDNLIVSGSIEEYQLTRLKYKARVANAVLTGMSDVHGKVTNDAKSLTKFLENYLENK